MDLEFNDKPSTLMHIDINSAFATIEQQANPLLRGKPIAVVAHDGPNGVILAPSMEAKKYGIKTAMRVRDAKALCPGLIVRSADPNKYRHVHIRLRDVLSSYTNDFHPKSIDEFVLNLRGYPCIAERSMQNVAREIKKRIKKEIGDWIWVSIGIGPSRFMAKLAAGIKKPDGLVEINKNNFLKIYEGLVLTDLCGINIRNQSRLNRVGIYTVEDFYKSPLWKLKAAFRSIGSYYWYTRLRGHEIDNVEFARRSYGNSSSLPAQAGFPQKLESPKELSPILAKLVNKMASRMRKANYKAQGVHLAITYKDGTYWHKGESVNYELFDTRDIFQEMYRLLCIAPHKKPVRKLAVSCFRLAQNDTLQLEIFKDMHRRRKAIGAMDTANERWGSFVVTTGNMLKTNKFVPDRIAFGGVKELEEVVLNT